MAHRARGACGGRVHGGEPLRRLQADGGQLERHQIDPVAIARASCRRKRFSVERSMHEAGDGAVDFKLDDAGDRGARAVSMQWLVVHSQHVVQVSDPTDWRQSIKTHVLTVEIVEVEV